MGERIGWKDGLEGGRIGFGGLKSNLVDFLGLVLSRWADGVVG